MNNQLEWLASRRSIRRYLPDAVPETAVNQLLTAACWAPSAHNRQPWRFVVMHKQATKEQLAQAMGAKLRADLMADHVSPDVIQKDTGRSYARITQAPLLILACLTMEEMDSYTDPQRQQNELIMAVQSSAMAVQNMLLAAHTLGLGGCWMCAPLFCPDTVRQTLALQASWQPQALITIGYPAESKKKARHPLATRIIYR